MSTKAIAATNNSTLSWSSSEGPTKREQIVYWTSTGIIAGIMLWSALNFAFNPNMKEAFAHFGLPNWFRIELTTAKILGVFALVTPRLPRVHKGLCLRWFCHYPRVRERCSSINWRSNLAADSPLDVPDQSWSFRTCITTNVWLNLRLHS